MSDKRILVISGIGCGPPNSGNRARMAGLLREIRRLGYRIEFAGVKISDEEKAGTLPYVDRWVTDFGARPERGVVRKILDLVIRGAVRAQAFISGDSTVPNSGVDRWLLPHWLNAARLLQERENYKRVLVAYVFHSGFLSVFPGSCLKLIDTHDIFSNRAEKLGAGGVSEHWFTVSEAEERRGLIRANRVIAIQCHEAAHFRRLLGDSCQVEVIGHFLTSRLLPVADDRKVIGYIASDNVLNLDAITWFLDEIWPRVLSVRPDLVLRIGGSVCRGLAGCRSVELVGSVENLEGFYGSCSFMVNPMRVGTGLKIKTVEALAFGRCVITTPEGAAGLELFSCEGIVVAEKSEDFASAILDLASDQEILTYKSSCGIGLIQNLNMCGSLALKRVLEVDADVEATIEACNEAQ